MKSFIVMSENEIDHVCKCLRDVLESAKKDNRKVLFELHRKEIEIEPDENGVERFELDGSYTFIIKVY